MSIPAETPAAVTISPLSTNRSSGRSSTVGSSSASRSSRPHQVVAGRSRRRPGGGESQRASAHARHERAATGIRAEPVEERLVLELRVDPGAPGDEQHVCGRRRVPRVVGRDPEALRAPQELGRVRDGEDRDAVVRMLRRPGREHLPRPREVELLDPLEQDDRDLRHAAMLRGEGACNSVLQALLTLRILRTRGRPRPRAAARAAPRRRRRGRRAVAAPRGCRARTPARRAASRGSAPRRRARPRGRPRR